MEDRRYFTSGIEHVFYGKKTEKDSLIQFSLASEELQVEVDSLEEVCDRLK